MVRVDTFDLTVFIALFNHFLADVIKHFYLLTIFGFSCHIGWTHGMVFMGSQFTFQQMRMASAMTRLAILFIHDLLNFIPQLPGDDRFVLARPDAIFVDDLADVDRVGENAVQVLGRHPYATVFAALATRPAFGRVAFLMELLGELKQ